MTKLIVLSGYSGSGKTTHAKELAKTGRFACVRSDDYYHCWREDMDVTQVLIDVAVSFARAGIDVIVDAVNKHPHDYGRWCAAARSFDAFEWIAIDTPIEECIVRDGLRSQPVGEVNIRLQAVY